MRWVCGTYEVSTWDHRTNYACRMATILLVADRPSVIDRVHADLSSADIDLVDHLDPNTAAAAAYDLGVDRVIVDQQVGAMGAMAVTRAVRARGGDAPIPVTVLLDRSADAFLARRSGAQNWVLTAHSSSELRAAIAAPQDVS
jgi:DNA-binding response OmpR family regulator